MRRNVSAEDRDDVESLIKTIESEGWIVADYSVDKRNMQVRVDLTIAEDVASRLDPDTTITHTGSQ